MLLHQRKSRLLSTSLAYTDSCSYPVAIDHLWPKNQEGVVRINLCFENNSTQSLMNYVIQGWETWLRYLANPGPSTRQALKVQFYKVPGQSQLPNCYTSPGVWNTALPDDCVVI